MTIKKITIIGISGTGKSTLALELSKALNIPAIHADQYIWIKGWKEADEKQAEIAIKKAMSNGKWVVEGWLLPTAKHRLQKADIILYLDYSGFKAMLGGLKRWWMYLGKKRPEMPEGCNEGYGINLKYLKVMYKRLERDRIEKFIKPFSRSKKLIRLRTRRETKKYLKSLLN